MCTHASSNRGCSSQNVPDAAWWWGRLSLSSWGASKCGLSGWTGVLGQNRMIQSTRLRFVWHLRHYRQLQWRTCWDQDQLHQGSLVSGISCLMIWGGADVLIIEIKCTINVMHLNHPQTIHPIPDPMEEWSFMKRVPGARKVGDHCHNLWDAVGKQNVVPFVKKLWRISRWWW